MTPCLALLLAGAVSAAAPPAGYELAGDSLVLRDAAGARHNLPLPCPATSLLVDRDRLYLACGARGAAVLALTPDPWHPSLVEIKDYGGIVVGFHVSSGVVWALVSTVEAKLLASADPGGTPRLVPMPEPKSDAGQAAAPAPATAGDAQESELPAQEGDAADAETEEDEAEATAPHRRRGASVAAHVEGRVVRIAEDGPIIDLGAQDGVQKGDHVAILHIERSSLEADGMSSADETVIAVGEIIATSREGSLIKLGLNERVEPDATVRVTRAPLTASRLANPRLGNMFDVRLSLRPFVGVGQLALGTLSDGHVSYRFGPPIRLHLVLEPLGVAWRDPGILLASSGNLILTFDHTYFEMGLGAGWSTAQVAPQPGYGVSLAQMLRFGSEDGLCVIAHNSFVLYDGRFNYGGTVARVRIPLWSYAWLDVVGGGGASGFFFGEVGLRILLTGNGGHGTWFVVPSVGGGGLFEQQAFGSTFFGGPLAGIAVEWRP